MGIPGKTPLHSIVCTFFFLSECNPATAACNIRPETVRCVPVKS
jgi:hypothetical protein